jgi:hypothetical protein
LSDGNTEVPGDRFIANEERLKNDDGYETRLSALN